MWGASGEESLRAHPYLPLLWSHPGPRRKRCEKHSMGWAGPSGSGSVGCRDELRSISRMYAGECQSMHGAATIGPSSKFYPAMLTRANVPKTRTRKER
jgi:hypothetical protein